MAYRLRINQSTDALSPNEWGEDVLVSRHRDLHIGTAPGNPDLYDAYDLDVYSHGAVSILLSDEPGYRCRWDTARHAARLYIRKQDRMDTLAAAKVMVEEWNMFLSGDVYDLEVTEVETCNLGHEHEVYVDSVSGVYGNDAAECIVELIGQYPGVELMADAKRWEVPNA